MASPAATRPVVAVAAALVGMVASTLQQTLLATATPTIVSQMGAPSAFAWVSGAYLLASTSTLPWAGIITDRVGARPMYAAGMGLFGLGTCGVTASPSMAWVLVWRVVQGVGAGALVPAALAAVGVLPEDRQRGRAFGAMGAMQVLANVAGPVVGGWFTAGWGGVGRWRPRCPSSSSGGCWPGCPCRPGPTRGRGGASRAASPGGGPSFRG